MAKKKKKPKLEKVDGLGPIDIKKIRNAVRQVWHRSHTRKLCVNRCIGKGGYFFCELCKKRTPVLKVDHIQKVGEVDSGFIKRMFTPSKNLQGLCSKCHKTKTRQERLSIPSHW